MRQTDTILTRRSYIRRAPRRANYLKVTLPKSWFLDGAAPGVGRASFFVYSHRWRGRNANRLSKFGESKVPFLKLHRSRRVERQDNFAAWRLWRWRDAGPFTFVAGG
jgi:hypothetical protein